MDLTKDIYTLPPFGRKEKKRFTLPQDLYDILKPHQKQGIEWLWKLHCSDMPGGIVADDMGLGKTLQVIIVMHLYCTSEFISYMILIIFFFISDHYFFFWLVSFKSS